MSQQADLIRDRRQHWAAPGGSHDRKVKFLAIVLPGLVGVVTAAMVVGPLFARGEISFLLDRTKVAMTKERVRVADAMYRGEDNQGRPFTVTASNAVQVSAKEPVIRLDRLAARILLSDGPAELTARSGAYNFETEQVSSESPVTFSAADGYRMTTRNIVVDLKTRRASGSGGVSGTIPSGTFSADRLSADLDSRVLTLDGNVHGQFQQHALRMPR